MQEIQGLQGWKFMQGKDSLDNETNLYQYCYNNPVVNSYENEGYLGRPGYRSGYSIYSLNDVKEATIKDLKVYGNKIYSVTTQYPSIGSGYKALAVRTGRNENANYHFMKLDSAVTGIWSFKAGWSGCVFKLSSGLRPNNITWCGYKYEGSIWKKDLTVQYNSSIYYIIYK